MDNAKMDRLLDAAEAFLNVLADEWQQWEIAEMEAFIREMKVRAEGDQAIIGLIEVLEKQVELFEQWHDEVNGDD